MRLDGARSFDMRLKTGEVSLGMAPGVELSKAQLLEVVDSAGLTLLEFSPPSKE
ncbi:MAG: hypothetical protein ACYTGX_04160 [Planctomycetota bacterium]|jgi:hypothetical protein